jgi:hypothetical protein
VGRKPLTSLHFIGFVETVPFNEQAGFGGNRLRYTKYMTEFLLLVAALSLTQIIY